MIQPVNYVYTPYYYPQQIAYQQPVTYPQQISYQQPVVTVQPNSKTDFQDKFISQTQYSHAEVELKKINMFPDYIYDNYKDNIEFQKLTKNEYFNKPDGEQKVLGIIKKLLLNKYNQTIKQKQNKNITSNDWHMPGIEYLDITKCLYNLNKVLSDKRISKKAKDYTVVNASNLRFQTAALDPLDSILGGNDVKKIEDTILKTIIIPYM